jgi:cell division control protein 6
MSMIVVLDEIDMIKDLNDLMYTLIRSNDELKRGGISIVGITNNAMFKRKLDSRTKSSLCETEMVFYAYNAVQMAEILKQRATIGIKHNIITDSAIELTAAIAAQESGDARYALKLLLKACDIVDERGIGIINEHEIEIARKNVDEDIAIEIINTLPQQQQIVLYAAAMLSVEGGKYMKLDGKSEDNFMMSGELYDKYCKYCEKYHFKSRSARWYRQYLSDLEMFGLITMVDSGAGMRGHTRLIKLAYPPHTIREIIEKIYGA